MPNRPWGFEEDSIEKWEDVKDDFKRVNMKYGYKNSNFPYGTADHNDPHETPHSRGLCLALAPFMLWWTLLAWYKIAKWAKKHIAEVTDTLYMIYASLGEKLPEWVELSDLIEPLG